MAWMKVEGADMKAGAMATEWGESSAVLEVGK